MDKQKNESHTLKEILRGFGSLFHHCANVMERWSRMEVSYCTFGFGTIIRRDYAHMIQSTKVKKTQASLADLAMKKSRGTKTLLHSDPKMVPQQIPPLKFPCILKLISSAMA